MTDEKPRVIIIPPKPEFQQTTTVTKQLRVAAYCRVSTKEEEQASSYEAQCEYYTDKIMSNKEWTMAGIFADEGITGTSTKKRTEFLRMIRQCKQKKIDLILTKSIQRFARNTLDCINYTRILRQLGVGVLFEKENINSLPADSEFMITMYGAMAQSESESISGNIRRGRQMHANVGTLKVPCHRLYGYKKDENEKFCIIPEQAEVVREIYQRYKDGASLRNLKDWLEENQIKTVLGTEEWSVSAIKGILTNEKYCGDVLLQKTFCTDFLTKKMKVNEGEVPQYYVENSHPAIVSDEVYEEVQLELERRRKLGRQHNSQHCFSGRIYCGCCGSVYGSKVWHSNDKYRRTVWQCNARFVKGTGCQTPHLSEPMIEQKFLAAFNQLLTQKDFIADDMQVILQHLSDTAELDAEKEALQVEMGIVSELIRQAVGQNASAALDQAEYNRKYNSLTERFHKAADRVKEIDAECARRKGQRREIETFRDAVLANDQPVTVFSTELWNATIDRMTVKLDGSVKVTFRNGIEITV